MEKNINKVETILFNGCILNVIDVPINIKFEVLINNELKYYKYAQYLGSGCKFCAVKHKDMCDSFACYPNQRSDKMYAFLREI